MHCRWAIVILLTFDSCYWDYNNVRTTTASHVSPKERYSVSKNMPHTTATIRMHESVAFYEGKLYKG